MGLLILLGASAKFLNIKLLKKMAKLAEKNESVAEVFIIKPSDANELRKTG